MGPPVLTAATIPATLRARPQWVVWRWATRDGKTTKIPHSPLTGQAASSTDPATWGTFADATAFQAEHEWVAGVGIVVTPADNLVGIDLDHCREDRKSVV